jgi:FKBP-type peptidyl-prolyl cis-trans isomerase
LREKEVVPKRKAWKIRLENADKGILIPLPRMIRKKNGIFITDYIIGKSYAPKLGSTVQIIYEAMFNNGFLFDSHLSAKKPFVFRLGTAQVIRGLDLGLEGMRIGGAREIIIPPELG